MSRRLPAVLLGLSLLAAACGGSGHKVSTKQVPTSVNDTESSTIPTTAGASSTTGGSTPGAATTAKPNTTAKPLTTAAPTSPVAVKLTKVASVEAPLALAQAPGDDALYLALQDGKVVALRNGAVTTILDISGSITSGGERGLLGLAFAPNRPAMDVYYTASNGDVTIDEYPFSGGQRTGGARRLLTISHSEFPNHNGGNLAYGPDNRLYAGTGDGGSGGDPHGHAQDPNSRLGKMLRIDAAANPATVETWMIGLRNPWRWSFDRANGDMWIGDVGQDQWEEINVAAAGTHGQNWGWNRREGLHAYNGGTAPAGNVNPIYDYHHDNGVCAVTGGYVYRGTKLGGWAGTYLFADECVGKIQALTRPGGTVTIRDTGLSASSLASFGQDHNGELYVLSIGSNAVYRIDPR